MKVLSTMKFVVRKCDLFRTNSLLRYRDDPEYQSVTGGICSLTMLLVFAIVFTQTIIGTVNKTFINASRSLEEESQPTMLEAGSSPFLFALGITNLDISPNATVRYFDFSLTQKAVLKIDGTNIPTTIQLVACNRSDWAALGQDFATYYDTIGFSTWLCPKQGTIFYFQGKFTSKVFKYIKFAINQCKAATSTVPCATAQQMTDFLKANTYFTLNYYFVNTLINEQDSNYLSYYLQDRNYFLFTPTSGMTSNVFFSSYNIQTDQSLMPNSDISEDNGGLVYEPTQSFTFIPTTQYLQLYLRKSSISLYVVRSFKKYDETLSYIGGLFSTIMTLLMIMQLYNEYSYEVEIGAKIYKKVDSETYKSGKFNFITFLGFLVYKFLKLIRCNPNWELMKDFDRNKEESAKQLDVHLLLRKITFLEDCMNVLFRPPELKGMYLKGILPIDDIIKTRRNYRLYRKTKKLAEEMGEYSKMDANISIEDQSEHKQNKGLRMVFPEQDQDGNNISVSHNAILSTPVANNSEQWEASSSQSSEDEEEQKKFMQNICKNMMKLQKRMSEGHKRSKRIYEHIDKNLLTRMDRISTTLLPPPQTELKKRGSIDRMNQEGKTFEDLVDWSDDQ